MKLSQITFLAAVGVLTPLAIAGGPGTVTTLFTNIATSTTSDTPGLPGVKFAPGNITTAFDRPWVSPNGSNWTIVCDTNATGTADAVVLLNGALHVQEGTATPFAPLETWGPPDVRLGLNDSGDFAIFTNTSAASTIDDYIAKMTAGPTWSVIAMEGLSIPALPTSTFDDDMDSITLLADGRVAFRTDLIDGGGISTANDEILVLDTTLIAQEGITTPALQLAAPQAWDNFTFENYWVSPDGLNILIDGDLLGATTTDDVTVYNGNVVIQEGFAIPGTPFVSIVVSGGPDEIGMDPAGRWYARGNNADGQDWVVRNATVLAKTDDPTGAASNTLDGAANAAQVVPPSASLATAVADFFVDTVQNKLWYDVVLTGVTGETAANISGFAGAGVNGAPLFSLPIGTTKRGFVTYLEIDEANILAGQTYLEILTTGNPAGEIRGQIVAETETWDDTDFADGFFAMAGNVGGDYIVAGVSSAPFDVNGLVVLNGNTVVLREGDPVDVDGNSLFDDDAYFQNFGNDDFVLTQDGSIYFAVTLRNGAGTAFAQGIFRREGSGGSFAFCTNGSLGVDHTTACPCGNTGAPGNGCGHSFDPNGANLEATGTPSLDDVVLHSQFEPVSSFTLFMQHANAGDSVFHDGVLCASNPLIRLRGRAAVAGEAFFPNSNFAQDSTTTLSIRGGTFPGSGATMRYAAWYRNASSTFCRLRRRT